MRWCGLGGVSTTKNALPVQEESLGRQVRKEVRKAHARSTQRPSWGAGQVPRLFIRYLQLCVELLWWLHVQIIAYTVWKGHLWTAAWRKWVPSLHMAVFVTFPSSLDSSFSSSSSPKFLSPSFSAFLPWLSCISPFLSLLPSSL